VRCDCADDSTAIKQAEHMLDGISVELWHLERRIGRFDTNASYDLSGVRLSSRKIVQTQHLIAAKLRKPRR
jgi:hypothetical protein